MQAPPTVQLHLHGHKFLPFFINKQHYLLRGIACIFSFFWRILKYICFNLFWDFFREIRIGRVKSIRNLDRWYVFSSVSEISN